MASIRHAIFSGLCFCILLSTRFIFKTRFATKEIYRATSINEPPFATPWVGVSVRETTSSTAALEINKTSSVSSASSTFRSDSYPLCSREEIKEGSWEPVILDAPPYVPSTVHLRCYPESEYKTGHWMHAHKWLPFASSSGNCNFSDWNREEFCRIMKRATVLVRNQVQFSSFLGSLSKLNSS